ncbi:hypothetical protein U1Q18_014296 [Sarracenia purpurea var. burkii]
MSGLSKLGTALSVVFVVSLVALVAEVVYVLWRRRLISRQTDPGDGGCGGAAAASKELLLYFLCWKHQSRIEPDGGSGSTANRADGTSPPDTSMEAMIDMMKLQGMYGPSRVLFTIKEEEKEDAESEKSLSLSSSPVASAEKVLPKKTRRRRVSLEECFSDDAEFPELTLTVVGDREATPYSTPIDSPLYYTPAGSPCWESGNGFPESGTFR